MPASQFDPAELEAIITGRFPELSEGPFRILAEGWDSVAVDVDDRLIFKFPRHPNGEAALRREVRILDLVGSTVSMRVPLLTLFEEPRPFSGHIKIPGNFLLTDHYAALGDAQRYRLGEELGLFYAELHSITPSAAMDAGAAPIYAWLDSDEILRRIWPVLPEEFRTFAETTMKGWAALPPDPLGMIYGYFDGHGWNMAFDHAAGALNGIYDFADSGIGPLHQEFISSNLISTDLTERIITAYERQTSRNIDRERVELLTGTYRLWELAMEAHLPDHVPGLIGGITAWANRR